MSAEYGVNIDYTSLGRIHFKIELMADSHEQALKSAQDVLNIQRSGLRSINRKRWTNISVTRLCYVMVLIMMLSNNSNNKKKNNR
jgi:hypothetical protein